MTYTQNNIEQMIDSINCNNDVIKELVSQTSNNGKIIDSKMSDYAKNSKKMNVNQITAYRDYAVEMRKFKDKMEQRAEKPESFNSIYRNNSTQEIQTMLEEIHNRQVGVMEFLCGLVEKSQRVICIFK